MELNQNSFDQAFKDTESSIPSKFYESQLTTVGLALGANIATMSVAWNTFLDMPLSYRLLGASGVLGSIALDRLSTYKLMNINHELREANIDPPYTENNPFVDDDLSGKEFMSQKIHYGFDTVFVASSLVAPIVAPGITTLRTLAFMNNTRKCKRMKRTLELL